ncbi:hypothetical protein GGH19_002804 [Coemansia sp. RSA 1807]|nr:hypothetical protein GGH19_002804 [Coemansia sp. RSA 1807]
MNTPAFGQFFTDAYSANPALTSSTVPVSLSPQYDILSEIPQPHISAFSVPQATTTLPSAAMSYGISTIPISSHPSQQLLQPLHNAEMLSFLEPPGWGMLSTPAGFNTLSQPANIALVVSSSSPNGTPPLSHTIAAQSPLLQEYTASQSYPPTLSPAWQPSAPPTAYATSHSYVHSSTNPEFTRLHGPLNSLSATQSPNNSNILISGIVNYAPAQLVQGHFSGLRSVAGHSLGIHPACAAVSMSPSPSKTSENTSDSDSNQGSDLLVGPFKAEGGWKNQPRNSISRKQKKLFYMWLLENTRFPFPTENERVYLDIDHVSEKQFKYWFANIRCRQFTKRRDSEGNLYFAPNAKFYESCFRMGLVIPHAIPADVRRAIKQPRKCSMRRV